MSRATKASHVAMGLYPAAVTAVRDLTPHLRRVTFGSPELRGFRDDGPDQRVTLLLPRAGQSVPLLPSAGDDWYRSWRAMPHDVRAVLRTYTIRSCRPSRGEVDIDLLLHGDTGPGSAWASRATVGDRVAIFGAHAEYEADPGARQLIAGDHAALPAIAAIVERLPAHARGHVLVELPDPAERLPVTAPAGVRVDWLDAGPTPGDALFTAVRALPAVPDYAWVAADSATAARVRRHLVRTRGLRPDQVMFMGYWRPGAPLDPD